MKLMLEYVLIREYSMILECFDNIFFSLMLKFFFLLMMRKGNGKIESNEIFYPLRIMLINLFKGGINVGLDDRLRPIGDKVREEKT